MARFILFVFCLGLLAIGGGGGAKLALGLLAGVFGLLVVWVAWSALQLFMGPRRR